MEEVGDNLILSLLAVARFKDTNTSSWEEPFPYKQKPYEDFQSSKVIISLNHWLCPLENSVISGSHQFA